MDSGSTRPQRKIAQISSKRPQLISALEAISSGRTDLPLDQLDASAVAWAIQSGFGPLLYRAVYQNPQSSISAHWSSLKAADLTAGLSWQSISKQWEKSSMRAAEAFRA
jgi:hypothetical protein